MFIVLIKLCGFSFLITLISLYVIWLSAPPPHVDISVLSAAYLSCRPNIRLTSVIRLITMISIVRTKQWVYCKYGTTTFIHLAVTTCTVPIVPDSIQWFIEDQVFSPSYDLASLPTHPPSQKVVFLSQSSSVSPVELTGLGRSQIIRRRESLVLLN